MTSVFVSGSWWLNSTKDPRWNATGRDTIGARIMPEKCREKFEELKKILGTSPDDLEWGYLKD